MSNWMERLCDYRKFALMRTAPAVDALYYANFSMEQLRKRAALSEGSTVKIEDNIISILVKGGYTIHIDNSGDVLRDSAQARGIFAPYMFVLLDVLLVQMSENIKAHMSPREITISMDDYLRLRDIDEQASDGHKYKYQCKLIQESLDALASISIDFDGSSKSKKKVQAVPFAGMKILESSGENCVHNHEIQVKFSEEFANYIQGRTTKMPYFGFLPQLDIASELTYAFARKLCQQYVIRWNQMAGRNSCLAMGSLVAVCPVIEDIEGSTKEAAKERRRKIFKKVSQTLDYLGRNQYIASNICAGSDVVDCKGSLKWTFQEFCDFKVRFYLCNCGDYNILPKIRRKKRQGTCSENITSECGEG